MYETAHLQIRILNGTYAEQSLRFYEEDRELFERYEPTRPHNFYMENYHMQIIKREICQQY